MESPGDRKWNRVDRKWREGDKESLQRQLMIHFNDSEHIFYFIFSFVLFFSILILYFFFIIPG